MRIAGHEVEVTVRANCRRLILRCRDGRLFLSVPPGTPKTAAERFVAAQEEWICEALRRHPAREQSGDPQHLMATVDRLRPVWEARMGVQASAIRYREMVSRWGSCQPKTGKITLNLRLADRDEGCIEYVLVHELCHLLHPDHSPAFHGAMTALMPDWQVRRRSLNT